MPWFSQALQELREPVEIDHARRFGQPLDRRAFHGVEDALQVFHRLFEEIGQCPDPDIGAAAAVAQGLDELRLRALQARRLRPDVREIPVRREQAHRPGPGDDRDLRIVVIGHEGTGALVVLRPEHEHLSFAPRVPDQVRQKRLGVVVAQFGRCAEAAGIGVRPSGEACAARREEIGVHGGPQPPRQPASKSWNRSLKPWNTE
jgi:hypothetical protein